MASAKSVVSGSDTQLADAVRKALGRLGGGARWEAQILGAGFTAGKKYRGGALRAPREGAMP